MLGEAAGSRRLVSVTVPVGDCDPSAIAFASRRADDRWFCWEQPDRDGFALAALGTAHAVVSRGLERFGEVVADCAAVARGRVADEPAAMPAGAGPVWVGGFAFAPEGGAEPQWSSLPPALMVLPEVAIVRHGAAAFLTLAAVTRPGADPEAALVTLGTRLASLRTGDLPLLDPQLTGETTVTSLRPPGDFERAVERATQRIEAGDFEKVVLAREIAVEAPAAYDPAAVHGALRELFPACFCFSVGTPQAAFVGASPELLVRRSGAVAATVALAGSTRRSADPAVDDHLGEQLMRSGKDRSEHEIVARRIERTLRPHAVWVEREAEPSVIKVANIQHLATPIHAQLAESRSALELAGMLHPTPAIGGEPRETAIAAIPALEGIDRGWYAGAIGWMDAAEDGEMCVGVRTALLRDRTARLFAGNGIVAASDPAAELAETEIKLGALLPLLAG